MSDRTSHHGNPYHHGNLRAALLERAWEVVDDEGAEGLSLRGLARDLGVSHGASARHFRDKNALLDAIAVEGFSRMNADLSAAIDGAGTPEAGFRATGWGYVSFAVRHPAVLRVMYSAKHRPDASPELLESSQTAMTALVELVADAQSSGRLRAAAPELLAVSAFAAVHGVATLATDDLLDGVPWQDAAASAIETAWRGLAR